MLLRIQRQATATTVIGAAGIVLLAALGSSGARAQDLDRYAAADIAYGAQIYANQCSGCHGPNGDGIAGIDLRANTFRRVVSDDDLRGVVTKGIPGTAMPPFRFDTAELAGVVAFVRTMRKNDSASVPMGDRKRGEALFNGAGSCITCHTVRGSGSKVAPDLSDIGTRRTPGELERSLLDPSGSMRTSNRSVRAVMQNGSVVVGRRLNEDTYTVQLIDEHERLISLVKRDLRSYTVLTGSPMPSYKDKLTSEQLADVVAYLLSLKGV